MRALLVCVVVASIGVAAYPQAAGVPYLNSAWLEALPDGDYLYHCRIHVGEVTADRLDLAMQFRFGDEGDTVISGKGTGEALLLWPEQWQRAAGPSPVWHPAPVRLSGKFFSDRAAVGPGTHVVAAIFDVFDPAAGKYVESGYYARAQFTLQVSADGAAKLTAIEPGGDFPRRDLTKEPPPPVVRRTTASIGGGAAAFAGLPVSSFVGSLAFHAGTNASRVAFARDGRSLVTYGDGDSLRWFTVDGRGCGYSPGRAVFAPDGSVLRLVGQDLGPAAPASAETDGHQPMNGPVASLAEDPGEWLAARLCADSSAVLFLTRGEFAAFDAATGKCARRVTLLQEAPEGYEGWPPERCEGAAISRCGRMAALAWMDGKRFAFDLFETQGGKLVLRTFAKWGAAPAFCLSPDGKTICSTVYEWGGPNGAALFDATTGERKAVLPDTSDAVVIVPSPDGALIAVGGDSGLSLFDATTGALRLKLAVEGSVTGILFTPEGGALVADTTYGVRTFAVATGKVLAEPDTGGMTALSPDGKAAATLMSDGTLTLWETTTGAVKASADRNVAMVLSTDGTRAAAMDKAGRTRVFDLATGKVLLEVVVPVGPLVLSGNGRLLAAGFSGPAPLFFDVDAGEVLYAPRAPAGNGFAPAFSPDGRTVAVPWTDRTIRVFDLPTQGFVLSQAFEDNASHVEFSRDGKLLGAVVDYGFSTVAVAPGAAFRQVFKQSWIHDLALSPDGTRVACGEKPPAIFDVATGECRVPLAVEELYGLKFRYNSDGTRLAVVTENGALRLFDAANGKLLKTFESDYRLTDAAFTADGKLAAVCEDCAVVYLRLE